MICTYLKSSYGVAKPPFENNTAESDFAIEMFRVPHMWDVI